MSRSSPLEQWVDEIGAAATTLAAYCRTAGLIPRLEIRHLRIPPETPQQVHAARHTLLNTTAKVQQFVIEPDEYLQRLAVDVHPPPFIQSLAQYLACVQWLCHFHVLSGIHLEGSVLYSEIAQITLVPGARLRRVARMMMTSNFLCEPRPGELAYNALSAHFVTNPTLIYSAMFLTDVVMPATAKLAKVTERFGAADQKHQTLFKVALNTNLPFGDFVAQVPKLQHQFAAYMRNIAINDEKWINQLVGAVPKQRNSQYNIYFRIRVALFPTKLFGDLVADGIWIYRTRRLKCTVKEEE